MVQTIWMNVKYAMDQVLLHQLVIVKVKKEIVLVFVVENLTEIYAAFVTVMVFQKVTVIVKEIKKIVQVYVVVMMVLILAVYAVDLVLLLLSAIAMV